MNLKDKTLWQRNAAAIGGMVLFAAGINFFIVPASLYNGGVLGISQIIRTLLIQVFPSLASGTDIAGIINFILNIPLFIMAYISIGKSFFSTLMTDKAHTQNINTEVVIYTKEEPEAILDYIVNEFHRDATWWEARGGYTEETTYMIVTILSKYECVHLRRGLKNIDEHAFVVVKEGMHIGGKYEKHL